MYICICVYMYICIHVYMYICISVYTHCDYHLSAPQPAQGCPLGRHDTKTKRPKDQHLDTRKSPPPCTAAWVETISGLPPGFIKHVPCMV